MNQITQIFLEGESPTLKKRLVSSANITGSNKRDAFGRSLTHARNRSGPRIDP